MTHAMPARAEMPPGVTLPPVEVEPGQALLTNMTLSLQTMLACMNNDGSARFGILYGPSGYGKTIAAGFTAGRTNAAYVEARSVWTKLTLLEKLAAAVGIARIERTAPRILDQLIEQLKRDPVPIIIDEMDYLVKRQMVDILRDILDATRVAILLIGMEELPAKLKAWEQFDNRILVHMPAQPASERDALALRDCYCTHVRLADDLALRFRDACHGVTRRIENNLKAAQRIALEEERLEIDLEWWGRRKIQTGDVDARRLASASLGR